MHSIRSYLARQSTERLEALLRAECLQEQELELDTILLICSILAERDPRRPDAREVFLRFFGNDIP